jgi:hypothetical protein
LNAAIRLRKSLTRHAATTMQVMRDHIHRQLEQAGVQVRELGAGCVMLVGTSGKLAVVSDLLRLKPAEIAGLVGAAWL